MKIIYIYIYICICICIYIGLLVIISKILILTLDALSNVGSINAMPETFSAWFPLFYGSLYF